MLLVLILGGALALVAPILAEAVAQRAIVDTAPPPVNIRDVRSEARGQSGFINLDQFSPDELARPLATQRHFIGRFTKRSIDVLASLGLLVVFLPLLILVAIAIKLESKGPVIYLQKRVGLFGEKFDIIKFRSMVDNAERDGAQWASKGDARITRVGRFIRKTRIDEIPQVINVLNGNMSFVGPRPERPELVNIIQPEIDHYGERHRVKPGITGWAQVRFDYGATIEDAREKLKYDLFYVRHYTPFMDILIILMTVKVALFGIGSR